MTEQEQKDLLEFRELYAALLKTNNAKTNNELFNAMLNGCKHSGKIFDALAAFPKEAMTNG